MSTDSADASKIWRETADASGRAAPMSNDYAGAVERLRQDILDPQGVWRHCRVAMVNKYDTEEVVGFPSFTVDDLRTVLSALSASEARANVAEAERDEVNALRVAIFKVLLDEAKVLVAPGEEPDAIRRLIERDRASEARLRVAVEALGRIEKNDPADRLHRRIIARQALATIDAALAEGEWLPIETLPFGWSLPFVETNGREYAVRSAPNHMGGLLQSSPATWGCVVKPTHWMPLPASPIGEKRDD